MRLPASWMSSEWNSASAREKVSRSPWAGVTHELDHVAEALLNVVTAVPGGEAGGERLDRPPQLAELAPLVVPLRTEGPPLDDVRVEQVPVADRPDARADVRAGADQALRLQDTQGFTDDGAGDLEPLADLLGHEGAVSAQVAGDDHLAELLDELAVQPASAAPGGAAAHAPQLGVRAVPGGEAHAVDARGLGVRVSVEFARSCEA